MRSLVYKDFMNLKIQAKMYVLILAVWIFMALIQGGAAVFGGMLAMFAPLVCMTACAYDERDGWDKYALTMPFGIKELVLSKYVLSLLVLAAGMALNVALSALLGTPFEEVLTVTGLLTAVGVLETDFILPVVFRFGTEGSRIVLMLTFFAVAAVAALAGGKISQLRIALTAGQAAMLALALGILLLPVSAALSRRWFGRKEF